MSELHSQFQNRIHEPNFTNDANETIGNFLIRCGGMHPSRIGQAAEILENYPDRDALGIVMDFASTFSHPTLTLAGMFDASHEALPDPWRDNPEIARTIVSMTGQIEAGQLRAQQLYNVHNGGRSPRVDERLHIIETLVTDLQAR